MTFRQIIAAFHALALFAAPAVSSAQNVSAGGERLQNGIAAIAEGEVITVHELREELKPIIPRIRSEVENEKQFRKRIDSISREVLQNMIDRILIVKEAEEKGIQIPQSFIESRYQEVINKDFGGDRGQFLEFLRSENKTPKQFREELRERVIVNFMRQRNQRSQSAVSPERIESFYTEHKARFYQHRAVHLRQIILMPEGGKTTEELMDTARDIVAKLESGAGFGDLARRYSQDQMSGQGGDWGWIRPGEIREELSEVAFSLEPGEHSDPIEIQGNVFVLQAEKKRKEQIQPLTQVREFIEGKLVDDIARETQQEWLERIREGAYVQRFI